MKKIIGIVVGVVVIVAVIFGIIFATGKFSSNNVKPDDSVLVQYYDNYLTQIANNKDADIYNNLLDTSLRKKFTEEQISQMFAYLKGLGSVKEYDKSKVKIETVKENNKDIYVVSSRIVYEKAPQLIKIKLAPKGNDLKIVGFSFTNEF